VKHLEHYLKVVKIEGLALGPESALFVAINGKDVGMSGEGIHKIFMKWVGKLRLGYKVSPHSARATFIGGLVFLMYTDVALIRPILCCFFDD
jgi:hypothetical protein